MLIFPQRLHHLFAQTLWRLQTNRVNYCDRAYLIRIYNLIRFVHCNHVVYHRQCVIMSHFCLNVQTHNLTSLFSQLEAFSVRWNDLRTCNGSCTLPSWWSSPKKCASLTYIFVYLNAHTHWNIHIRNATKVNEFAFVANCVMWYLRWTAYLASVCVSVVCRIQCIQFIYDIVYRPVFVYHHYACELHVIILLRFTSDCGNQSIFVIHGIEFSIPVPWCSGMSVNRWFTEA